jgi:hypothetical protein
VSEHATNPDRRIRSALFAAGAAWLVFLAYLVTFYMVGIGGWWQSAASSLRNLIPLLVLAPLIRLLLLKVIVGLRLWLQILCHGVLSVLFSVTWYWMLMLLLGLARGASMTQFRVEPVFSGPAFGWQFLQGLTFYALVVAVVLLRAKSTEPAVPLAIPEEAAAARAETPFNRYLIRIGDDIHPIDVSNIVMITGADDYAEVTTRTSRHLAKMTMADFESSLPDGRFVRVHRSRIINLDCISRAEPAGNGRLLIHMITGDVVAASRAGSKLLRERVI